MNSTANMLNMHCAVFGTRFGQFYVLVCTSFSHSSITLGSSINFSTFPLQFQKIKHFGGSFVF